MNNIQQKDAESKFEKYSKLELTPVAYEKAHKKSKRLGDQIGNFKLLLAMVKDIWAGNFKVSTMDMAIITGAILYVVTPIDAIPDLLPFLGWVDDIAIISMAMGKLSKVIGDYKFWKGTM